MFFALLSGEEVSSNLPEYGKAHGAETSEPARGPTRVLTASTKHQTCERGHLRPSNPSQDAK